LRKTLFRAFIVSDCEGKIVKTALAGHPSGGFAGGLDRWEQEGHQYADDGDNDQELD
jgi:hypothetical protein